MVAPHSAATRSIMPIDRDRDDPGRTGTSIPRPATVDEAAVVVVVEEELGDEHAHAGVDLRAQVREVLAQPRESGCGSG